MSNDSTAYAFAQARLPEVYATLCIRDEEIASLVEADANAQGELSRETKKALDRRRATLDALFIVAGLADPI